MNTRILLLAVSIAALSSCSVYKAGQTPDDVYYSPSRVQAEKDSYVEVRQEKAGSNYQSYEQYQDNYRDDRFLRMSIGNPYYMNSYNSYGGFDWRSNSFYNGFNYGFNSPWNNYFAWNNFYNPYALSFGGVYGGGGFYGYPSGGGYYNGGGGYYSGGGYYGGGAHYPANVAPITRPRVFNVNSYSNGSRAGGRTYSNNSYNTNPQRYNNGNGSGNRSYYNNSGSNNSNNRSMYTPSNNNSSNNNSSSRSYTPSSSGSSGSSSGGSSGGGGVSRPTRGN